MMGYPREEVVAQQGASPSFLAVIVSGVTLCIAIIVHIAGIAVPAWYNDRRHAGLWESGHGAIHAVRAMLMLGLIVSGGALALFVFILVRGKEIWSTRPLRLLEKAIVIAFVVALFMAGLLIMLGVVIFTVNYTREHAFPGFAAALSLGSSLIFLMGSGLSGKAAADIVLNRK